MACNAFTSETKMLNAIEIGELPDMGGPLSR